MFKKRKRYFVDRSVQGALVLRLAMQWAVFLLLSCLLLFFMELLGSAPQEAGMNMLSRHSTTAVALIILAPIFIRDVFKLSNRFAGPMVRLRRAMQDLADGKDVPPIKFRNGDFWQTLADDFNRVSARVRAETHAEGVAPESAPADSTPEEVGAL